MIETGYITALEGHLSFCRIKQLPPANELLVQKTKLLFKGTMRSRPEQTLGDEIGVLVYDERMIDWKLLAHLSSSNGKPYHWGCYFQSLC